MDNMEDRLNSILGNPDMMAQIMSMAQKLGSGEAGPSPPPQPQPEPVQTLPDGLDMGLVMKLAGMARSANIDHNQKSLLVALRPYLPNERIVKLEKAMRASRLANLASELLGTGMLSGIGR